MIRLFVALPVPEDVTLGLNGMCSGLPGAKWVSPENYHLTLRFVGEVERGLADDLDAALSQISAPAFDVTLTELGYFSRKDKVTSLIARASKGDPLVHLQRKIESAAVRVGLGAEERKFKPHVTLARMKAGDPLETERFCVKTNFTTARDFRADRFILYSSFLSSSGAIYTPEVEYPLTA